MANDYITHDSLRGMGCALIVLVTLVASLRLMPALMHPRTFGWDDGFLLLSYLFFLTFTIALQVATDSIFRFDAVSSGRIPEYEAMEKDGVFVQVVITTTSIVLWLNLWSVKFSLLAFYKKLIDGLRTYTIIWTTVVVFCLVMLVGAITSAMLICSSLKAFVTYGACGTYRDKVAGDVNLWFTFSADVFTDLLIMLLPIGIVWNVRMPRRQKASICILFCLGLVCILFAILRVQTVGGAMFGPGLRVTPRVPWMAYWGTLEGGIATIIGCCPGLYRRFKPPTKYTKASYYSRFSIYPKFGTRTTLNTSSFHDDSKDLELQSEGVSAPRIRRTTDINITAHHAGGDVSSSQEELTATNGGYRGF